MASKVLFVKVNPSDMSDVADRVERLGRALGLPGAVGIEEGKLAASEGNPWAPRPYYMVKTHFGEMGNNTHINPMWIKPIVAALRTAGVKVFVADTNTLYVGSRSNAVDHLETARAHGFTHESLGAPVIIADGLRGESQSPVEVNLKHYESVWIANDARAADGLVVATNVTGHCESAFAGSIKNIGMGLAGRGGKRSQHCDLRPTIDAAKCAACGACVPWCPAEAITVQDTAIINDSKCIGCGECHAMCPNEAVHFEWNESSANMQEKLAEHCVGVLKGKKGKAAFFNFLTAVTKDCNCMGITQKPEIAPIGILASTDLVAIDQAAADMVNAAAHGNLFERMWPEFKYSVQLEYAERIGLGSRAYEIVEVD